MKENVWYTLVLFFAFSLTGCSGGMNHEEECWESARITYKKAGADDPGPKIDHADQVFHLCMVMTVDDPNR